MRRWEAVPGRDIEAVVVGVTGVGEAADAVGPGDGMASGGRLRRHPGVAQADESDSRGNQGRRQASLGEGGMQ